MDDQKERNYKFCQNCGAKIDIKAIVCPNCGVAVAGGPLDKEKAPEKEIHQNDGNSIALNIIGFLIPLIGFIMWIAFHNDYPERSKNVGISSLAGFILGIIIYICYGMTTGGVIY